jgi:Arylsulfotransferase (ASST)
MFDDHCCQITGGGTYVSPTGPSRGLVLKLDQQTHTAALAGQYSHGSRFDSDYMGSLQPLSNGNEIVGWGSSPFITEYSAQGDMLLDARLPGSDISYRAEVEPWVGLPLYPPVAAARRKDGKTTVYATWNGATEVASWKVLSGADAQTVATAAKSGFETAIPVSQSDNTFTVQALDAHGKVIGTSRQFSARG